MSSKPEMALRFYDEDDAYNLCRNCNIINESFTFDIYNAFLDGEDSLGFLEFDLEMYVSNGYHLHYASSYLAIKKYIHNIKMEDVRFARTSLEYVNWRKNVFERDNYTCQVCGKVGGTLNAHHIKSFALHKKLRLDVNNGITLCEKCHKEVHKKEKING